MSTRPASVCKRFAVIAVTLACAFPSAQAQNAHKSPGVPDSSSPNSAMSFPLPDPLTMQDGTKVTSAAQWREKRRPELLRLFEENIYGRTLAGRPNNLRFVVREEKQDARGGKATRLRVGVLFEGREEGRQMELLVYLPNNAKQPVPLFLGLNFDGNFSPSTGPINT